VIGGNPVFGQRLVERIGDIPDGIDERAVEIEDEKVVHAAYVIDQSMSPKEKPEKPVATMSGIPLKPVYRAEDVRPENVGEPGQFPYTRGIHETMYRGKLWTMRMFAGFGTPEDTNRRFHFLLEQGQTGLSTAFDMPTLMGYDPDHSRSLGEVGREGVSVAC